MKFFKIIVAFTSIMACTMAEGYGDSSGYSGGTSSGISMYGGGSSSGRGKEQGDAPKPYSFDYNAADGKGNNHYRNEQGDQNGKVKGTYGYMDAQGLYRVVEYVADENGFRANIRTNEPGVDGKESPADVVLTAEQPPAGIQNEGSTGNRKPAGSAPSVYSMGSRGADKPKSGSGKSGY